MLTDQDIARMTPKQLVERLESEEFQRDEHARNAKRLRERLSAGPSEPVATTDPVVTLTVADFEYERTPSGRGWAVFVVEGDGEPEVFSHPYPDRAGAVYTADKKADNLVKAGHTVIRSY